MADERRFKLTLSITMETMEGHPFAAQLLEWSNLPEDQLLAFEHRMADLMKAALAKEWWLLPRAAGR
jgi:hypothetical protein